MDIYNHEYADTISIDTLEAQLLEENLLKEIKEEQEKEILKLNNLSKKVCYLHTSLLYYRNAKSKKGAACYEAWKTLVKNVGGTTNGWRDLGYSLGVCQDDLDYIMKTVKEDPCDVVLKVFLQSETATLDKIIDALLKMNYYKIVKAMEEPLLNLAQCFSKDDSGFHSNSKDGTREIISYSKNVTDDLPPVLNKNVVIKNVPEKPKLPLLKLENDADQNKNSCPMLFLTYTDDGIETAQYIQNCVKNWIEVDEVIVVTLNDRKKEVYRNPEKFIREYFEKADIIIPIITPGYLNEIGVHQASVPNTSENLDSKYVSFIYNLIINYYIHGTGCYNKKVRSVLSECVDTDQLIQRISLYPDLLPWTHVTYFDEQFKCFLDIDS